ncbi:MAG TPA: biotin/lipoyl-binding protein, partial [Pseudomonadales bacterium]|nr:biotin/lipoyl-binding protein [Pseudomonadales bacterium]
MKRFWRIALVLVAASAVAAVAWAKWAGPGVTVTKVKRAALHHTIVASGRVETPERFPVASTLLGRVTEVKVDEGDRVSAGDLLATLDASDLTAAVQQAQANVALAQARLERLKTVTEPLAQE